MNFRLEPKNGVEAYRILSALHDEELPVFDAEEDQLLNDSWQSLFEFRRDIPGSDLIAEYFWEELFLYMVRIRFEDSAKTRRSDAISNTRSAFIRRWGRTKHKH